MSDIVFIDQPIDRSRLKHIASQRFGDLVKAVVDLERRVMAAGAELHADEEAWLLQQGSLQQNLWGINLYPDLPMSDMLEFDSMINIRPSQNNHSRSVESPAVREAITALVKQLIID